MVVQNAQELFRVIPQILRPPVKPSSPREALPILLGATHLTPGKGLRQAAVERCQIQASAENEMPGCQS